MSEKITIIHDRRVYEELKQLKKMDRKFMVFAIIATAYIYSLVKKCAKLDEQIKEITETEGE